MYVFVRLNRSRFLSCIVIVLWLAPHFASAQMTVTAVSPGINVTNAPAYPEITVTFSEPADAGSVNDSTVFVYGSRSGRWLPGDVDYDASTRTARLTRGRAFAAGESVRVIASRNILSAEGDSLRAFVWQFRVAPGGGSGVFAYAQAIPIGNDIRAMQSGDFDGDGRDDLVLALGYADMQLFLATDDGAFAPGPTWTMPRYAPVEMIATGDFDGDGTLDIVGTSGTSDVTATLLFNDGFGSFRRGPSLDTGYHGWRPIVADFDGDGWLDIGFNNGALFVNDSKGGFSRASATLPDNAWLAEDLNNDGSPDVISFDRAKVYLNDGRGNFSEGYENPAGGVPYLLHIDDDGYLDLLLVQGMYTGDDVEYLLNDGTGRFSSLRKERSAGVAPLEGDLDGDGDTDIVWFSNGVTASLNDGAGRYRRHSSAFPAFGGPSYGTLMDVDGSGSLDLVLVYPYSGTFRGLVVVTNGPEVQFSEEEVRLGPVLPASSEARTVMLYNYGADELRVEDVRVTGTAFSASLSKTGIASRDSAVVTLTFQPDEGRIYRDTLQIRTNRSGAAELTILLHGRGVPLSDVHPAQNALVPEVRPEIRIVFSSDVPASSLTDDTLLLDGSLSGARRAKLTSYDVTSRTAVFLPEKPFGFGEVVTATVIAESMASYQWLFRIGAASGDGHFTLVESQKVGSHPWSIAVGDLDGDGSPDLATGSAELDQIILHWNDGRGRFSERDTLTPGGGLRVELRDLDRDEDLDILVGERTENWVGGSFAIRNHGARSFRADTSALPRRILLLGDINGDGLADFITTSAGTAVDVFLDEGGGTYRNASTLQGVNAGLIPVRGDFDGDGVMDVGLSDASRFALYRGTGDGAFRLHSTLPMWYFMSHMIPVDIDGDGDLDIVGSLSGSYALMLLINRGDGHFTTSTLDTDRNSTGPLVAGDFDANGKVDLAVGAKDRAILWTFLNDGSGTFSRADELQLPHVAFDLAAADLDGDGDIDLAAVDAIRSRLLLLDNNYQLPVRMRATPDTSFARNSDPHLLLEDIRSVFSDLSGSPWIEYSVGSTNTAVRPVLGTDFGVVVEFEDNFHGRVNLFLTATNASGSTSDILELTISPPADPPVFSAAFPDTLELEVGVPYALDLWKVVDDQTTEDADLRFDFRLTSDSVRFSFDEASGMLILTALQPIDSARLRIAVADADGEISRRSIALRVVRPTGTENEGGNPERHELGNAFPNPASGRTAFEVRLSRDSELVLELYSVLGRRVAQLHRGHAGAGTHVLFLDATDLPPGLYICRLRTGDGFVQSRPLVVLR